ncbi:response regulator transcription factor [Cohnella ginsengisoli]|uniref:Response regulator transcription factor n=1 Tax=Cohnella ginsengisoli TaxID=425004 RepID=A0A9X4KNA5_9BACL|nr:response regulator transcription factor [Cohnella ginsengisoli]MDG0795163.1 response regulator transcription factor [Cohnella ginsengisoli]
MVVALTSREVDILRLMGEGLSNKQIAFQLSITEGTVKTHVINVYGKLQVNKRVQAINKAKELQLLN